MDTKKPGSSVVPWSLVVAGFLIMSLWPVGFASALTDPSGYEDFEGFEALETYETSWLEFSTASGSTESKITGLSPVEGNKSYYHAGLGGGTSFTSFDRLTNTKACSATDFPDLQLKFSFATLPSENFSFAIGGSGQSGINENNKIGGSRSPDNNQFRLDVNKTGHMFAVLHGDDPNAAAASSPPATYKSAAIGPLQTSTNYTVIFGDMTCTVPPGAPEDCDSGESGTPHSTYQFTMTVLELETVRTVSGELCGVTNFNKVDQFPVDVLFMGGHETDTLEEFRFDNLAWGGEPSLEAFGTCPNPAADLFGYNYVEGVEFTDSLTTGGGSISLDDFYFFTGDMSDNAYVAKSWHTTPSQDFYTRATLETATEGTSGTFRFVFSHVDPTQWVSADNFTTAAKGDGSTTGVFANATEVFFTETGNDWEIKVIDVNSGSRVQVGQSFVGLDPNTATSLEIGLNTETGEDLVYIENDSGTRLFEVIPNNGGSEIYSLWLVGAGLAIADSFTAMNDNDGPWASSCWFWNDLEDPTLLGNPGSLPFEEGITEEPDSTSTATGGIGSGIFGDTDAEAASAFFGGSTGAANFFFGALFIVGMAAAAPALTSGTRIDATPSMIAGGVLGLVMGWAFGFISGTFMFVLVVLSVAGVGLWFWGRS